MAAHHANNGRPDGAPSPAGGANPQTWKIWFDGQVLPVREGQTVAAVLMAAGHRTLRTTARRQEPRGLFCGMGICFDCLVQIDGRPNVRACQTMVRDGMRVESQQGAGAWEPVS